MHGGVCTVRSVGEAWHRYLMVGALPPLCLALPLGQPPWCCTWCVQWGTQCVAWRCCRWVHLWCMAIAEVTSADRSMAVSLAVAVANK